MTNALTINPIVTIKDGKVFANSRDVAEYFGKQHGHVLRDIDALLGSPNLDGLFVERHDYHQQARKEIRSFDMTRDGFTLLAMGFTGKQALQFKLAYIAAYNEMEAKLKASAPALPNFTDPAEAAIAWANEYRAKQAAQRQVEELKPLALVGSRAVSHEHSGTRLVGTLAVT